MKNTKLKKSILGALIALLVVCLAVTVGLNWNVISADAARSVTISGSTIFYTAEGAEVWSHQQQNADGEDEYYTMFVLHDNEDAVKYRRNLAYEWKYNANEDADDDSNVLDVADGYFSMEIGFEAATENSLGFEKYVLAFQSQQFTATDDSVTTNYIMFAPNATDSSKLNVYITDDADAAVPETEEGGAVTVDSSDIITVSFAANDDKGAYTIQINGKDAGVFTNIGGTYSKYVSSTTNPVIPITFSAEFGDEEDGDQIAKLVLYEMNNQSFMLNSAPGTETEDGVEHYKSGKVDDNAAPVICLDSNLNYMQKGEEISFDYTVIDVLASSPSITTSYFMLTNDQAEDTSFDPSAADGTYNGRNIYKTVTSSDKQYLIPHADSYVPTAEDNEIFDGEDLTASALVKIAVKLTDTTASGGLSTYVFLDWYADENYLVTINGADYIAVAEDSVGATYAYVDETNETNDISGDTWQNAIAEYQELVDEAAADLKAGSKNKFYLPDASGLFSDKCTEYEDLSFSIYYNNGSQQSSSSLAYNNLSITLSKSGVYVFTIYVTDADGNNMWYYNPDYQEGVSDPDDQKKEFETGDIWNMYTQEKDSDYEDTRQYLPWFTFTINDSELSIDDPGDTDIAYIDTTYSSIDFDINGVEYTETYKLFYFNNDDFAEYTAKEGWSDSVLQEAGYEAGDLITYDILYNNIEYIYKTYRNYFKTIVSTDEMEDNYAEYEYYRDYAWSTSSLSFVPQEAGYYVCTCTVESTGTTPNLPSVTAYMVITASEKPDSIYGEDTWVSDNVASIVLLCVAGAALIGIILLIVIKPKEKQDIDEVALLDSAAAKKEKAKAEKKKNKKK
ncbi:MAG: hypothetical protein LUD51_03985 [Clostridia bacterium]|nr:hypothetical protein [Clostridia bacterium]